MGRSLMSIRTRRRWKLRIVFIATSLSLLAAVGGRDVIGGLYDQSTAPQGIWNQGIWNQGIWNQGIWNQGIWNQGIWNQGIWNQGIWNQGIWNQGIWNQGIWNQGIWNQGITWDGISSQSINTLSAQQVGVDRGRSSLPEAVFLGIARANVQLPGRQLQGLQPAPPPA